MKKIIPLLLIIILASSAIATDLDDFPELFVSGDRFTAKVVVGAESSAASVLIAAQIIGSIQKYKESMERIDAAAFDTEINKDQDMILIGIPSAYSTQSNKLIDEFDYPTLEPGKSYINLLENGNDWVILVTAENDNDLRSAGHVLSNYKDYNLNCDTVMVTGNYASPSTIRVRCLDEFEPGPKEPVPELIDIEPECTETDNGKDIENRGITQLNGEIKTDTCDAKGKVIEYYCLDNMITTETIDCQLGYTCKDGACVIMPDKCQSDTDCDDGNACTSDICTGTPKDCQNTQIGTGCNLQNSCVPVGTRTDTQYCAIGNEMTNQKSSADNCNNNYECQTNFCLESKCTEPGFFTKIISWFKNLFG